MGRRRVNPQSPGGNVHARGNDSRRSTPLPAGWKRIRARILRRDAGICYVCGRPGADAVDHIIPASRGGSDEDGNLAAIHSRPCHAAKTAAEANAVNPRAVSRKRAPEAHPGQIKG